MQENQSNFHENFRKMLKLEENCFQDWQNFNLSIAIFQLILRLF